MPYLAGTVLVCDCVVAPGCTDAPVMNIHSSPVLPGTGELAFASILRTCMQQQISCSVPQDSGLNFMLRSPSHFRGTYRKSELNPHACVS